MAGIAFEVPAREVTVGMVWIAGNAECFHYPVTEVRHRHGCVTIISGSASMTCKPDELVEVAA